MATALSASWKDSSYQAHSSCWWKSRNVCYGQISEGNKSCCILSACLQTEYPCSLTMRRWQWSLLKGKRYMITVSCGTRSHTIPQLLQSKLQSHILYMSCTISFKPIKLVTQYFACTNFITSLKPTSNISHEHLSKEHDLNPFLLLSLSQLGSVIDCFLLKCTLGIVINFYPEFFMHTVLYLQLFTKEPDIF